MKSLLLACCYCLCSIAAFAQWQQMAGPKGAEVSVLERVGVSTYAGTDAGLYRSEDNGLTWQKADFLPYNAIVTGIAAAGDTIMLAVAEIGATWNDEPLLYRSEDAGITWTVAALPSGSGGVQPATFYGDLPALYFGHPGSFSRYDPATQTWVPINAPGGFFVNLAVDGEHLVLSNYTDVHLSTDGGQSWALIDPDATGEPVFLEDSLIISFQPFSKIKRSTDLGATWQELPAPFLGYYQNDGFVRGSDGALYLLSTKVFRSTDDGSTWTAINNTGVHKFPTYDLLAQNDGSFLQATKGGMFRSFGANTGWMPSSTGMYGSSVSDMFELPNKDILARTNLGNFRNPYGTDDWLPVNLPFNSRPELMIRQNDTVYVTDGDFTLYSVDNLLTLDTIAALPSIFAPDRFLSVEGRFYIFSFSYAYSSADLTNWTPMDIELPNSAEDVGQLEDLHLAADGQTLLAVTGNGFVLRSTDGGATWGIVLDFASPGTLPSYLRQVGDQLTLNTNVRWYNSPDDGLTWTQAELNNLPSPGGGSSLSYTAFGALDNLTVAAVSGIGTFVSLDAGNNWQSFHGGDAAENGKSVLVTEDQIYLGTDQLGVWRTGADFQRLVGTVYEDLNNNGMREADEPGFGDALVYSSPDELYTQVSATGTFQLLTEAASDTLRATPTLPYSTVQPAFHLLNSNALAYDFAVSRTPNMDDLRITLTEATVFRPGFGGQLFVTVDNIGTTTRSPVVRWPVPAGVSYESATIAPSTVSADSLTWEFGALAPGESVGFAIDIALPADTPLGTEYEFTASVGPFAGDQNIADNGYKLPVTVVGSYDPNDKRVEPAGLYTPDMAAAGLPLVYTVRFQNTGTFYAERVVIVDTLDARLDPSTFNLRAASHAVEWNISGRGVLQFDFDQIFLIDSTTNEPESHGFVQFSLQVKPGLELGDEIPNFADIYFDFNEPIRTNTITSVYDQLSITVLPPAVVSESLQLTPNPARRNVVVNIDEPLELTTNLRVYTTSGKLVYSGQLGLSAGRAQLTLPNLSAGIYTVIMHNDERRWQGRLVVVGDD